MLITYGTVLRRCAINKVGGFNTKLKYKEDQELGERLSMNGYFIIGDPNIKIFSIKNNNFFQLMERYSRWHMDIDEKPSLKGYLHNIKCSFRPMMQNDIKEKDYFCVLLTMLTPHFQLFYSLKQYFKSFFYN